MAKDSGRKPPPSLASELHNLEDHIHRRAYELYEARGREDGHELDDWLQAEAEILRTRQKATAA